MKFIVLLVIVFQFPSFAIACSMIAPERIDPEDALENSDLVIAGTLQTLSSSWFDKFAFWKEGFWRDDELDNDQVLEVIVASVLKGKPRDNIYLMNMQYGLCGPFLKAGDSISLIYLNSPKVNSQIYSIVLIDSIDNLHEHILGWRN